MNKGAEKRETLTKGELADICGVSQWKVNQWVNVDFFDELCKLGYRKHQHIFTPAQTRFLRDNIIEGIIES
jgi:hypothetical protein